MRCWQKTGRSFGPFSPSSPGSARNRERSWLGFTPGFNSTLSHRRLTHRWESPITHTHAMLKCIYCYTHQHRFKCIFVSQGCVSCSTVAGDAHSPLPPAPDSSCPLESTEQDSIGPVVDTWETLKPKEPASQLTAKQPCQKPSQLQPCISSDQCEAPGHCALVRSWTCFVKLFVAGPGHKEHGKQEHGHLYSRSGSLSEPTVTAFIGP